MKPVQIPNLLEYENFRRYLTDWYNARKQADPSFSYKRMAEAAGVASANYPKLLMDGERGMTVSNIHRFAEALDLSPREIEYFETLVHLNQAESESEVSFYRMRLNRIKRESLGVSMVVRRSNSTALLNSPVAMAVVVAVHELPLEDAVRRIQIKTGLRPDTIQTVIQILMTENLLRVTETPDAKSKRYELTEKYIQFQDRQSRSANQKQYIRAQLQESAKALESRYAKDAKFYCNTFTIGEKSLPRLQERVGQLIDDLMNETNSESPDRVIQLNVQLFPTIQKP